MPEALHHLTRFQTLEAFEAWERGRPGTYELHRGQPVAMAPERLGHTRIKANTWRALDQAIRPGHPECEAIADGATLRGGETSRFQPDAMLTCGPRTPDDDLGVTTPILVVEVLSPSTQHVDASLKLGAYFDIPSVTHYLVVSSTERLVVHHRRADAKSLLTTLHRAGPIHLDPPGIEIHLADLYRGTDLDIPAP